MYLCRDYNIDLLKIHTVEDYSSFFDNVIVSSFVPKITLPTRICDTRSSLINNNYTNTIDKDHTSGILIGPISDHQMYFSIMNENVTTTKSIQKYIEIEVCSQENMDQFKIEVANTDLYNKLNQDLNTDPNCNYDILSAELQAAKNLHIPRKIKKFNRRKHKKEKWMTNDLLLQIVTKNKKYVKWKSTPITHDNYEQIKQNFKIYEKDTVNNIREAKKQYFDRIFTAYQSDINKTWRTINETLNRNKKNGELPTNLFHDGVELSDAKEIATAFNSYFATIGEKLAASIHENNNVSDDFQQYLDTPAETRLKFNCITENETIKAINRLENKSSSGHDGISNKLLKLIKNELKTPLTLIINQMITTGIFPQSFKISKIIPLYKKGDHSLLTNYRPISLLPTISKVFERIIYDQMYEYLNENNLLAEEQFGFRKYHSTEYAAISLVDHISNEMEHGKTPGALYIDSSKAFDTLSFDIILYKLNYYGIAGTELQLLTNYLKNRKQYVIFNNHESDLTEITTGVPQGSILGSLLFSIIINDLKKSSKKLRFLMYADDTTIYFNLEDFDSNNFEFEINAELQKVSMWLKKNKLSLNLDKTKLMIFHRQQKRVKELNITINGTIIERVQSFNFLGITISESMSWANHLLFIKKKISKVIGILYRLKNTFPSEVLKTLYKSLVLSYINYGLLLWGVEVKNLEVIQKRAIRLITGSNYIAHTEPLFIQLGLLKVQDIFKLRLLKFYYKLCYGTLPHYFNHYREIIERQPVRPLRQHLIHPPFLRTVYAECTPLYQLIKLINILKTDKSDTILEKLATQNCSYSGFSYHIVNRYLNAYDPICKLKPCFVCIRI